MHYNNYYVIVQLIVIWFKILYKNWVNWVFKKLNSPFCVVYLSSEFVNPRV
jgi:hypothetical protein